MKITDPLKVEITDDIRKWAANKYGAAELPGLFLQEFKDSCKARGPKYKDAVQAFQNWITWSAPSGRFYKADVWESRLNKAKKMDHGKRMTAQPEMVAGQYLNAGKPTAEAPIVARSAKDVAAAAIATLRAKVQA